MRNIELFHQHPQIMGQADKPLRLLLSNLISFNILFVDFLYNTDIDGIYRWRFSTSSPFEYFPPSVPSMLYAVIILQDLFL